MLNWNTQSYIIFVLVVWCICGFITRLIGDSRNYKYNLFLFGFLFGIFGVIFVAMLPLLEGCFTREDDKQKQIDELKLKIKELENKQKEKKDGE